MDTKKYKFCQSCSMPLKADPKGGGTNLDGSINEKYCSYCYQNGEFTYKCDDVKQFAEHCKQVIKASGKSTFLAWLFSRGLSRLERWKK